MEWWLQLLLAVVTSGIITAVVTGIQNKRITNATANNGNADFTAKIIEQAEQRVKHAIDDRDRALAERNDSYAEAKGQRKAKQEWRDKFLKLEKESHTKDLRIKDLEAALAQAEWDKCTVNGCSGRKPPRNRDENDK